MNLKDSTAQRNLIVFDDDRGQWGPLTDLRAVFDLPSGMLSSLGRLSRMLNTPPAALFVPQGLAQLTALAHPQTPVNALPPELINAATPCLLVYGGLSTPQAIRRAMSLQPGQALIDPQGRLAAGCLSPEAGPLHPDDWHVGRWGKVLRTLTPIAEPVSDLLLYPWDIHKHLEVTLRDDLSACRLPAYSLDGPQALATQSVVTLGEHPIQIAATARLQPMVVINAQQGPVVIDEQAVIQSFAVLTGPCYIGPGTTIAPHTQVRACSSIAGSCVIGGEVSAVVIDRCTNKCHAGYLGNALVGRWVNLGADTSASNLKNTFGHVRMTLEARGTSGGHARDSGLMKLGPVIGDFVRTAIGTRLLTGSCIGTGSMLAVSDFLPRFVDRFSFVTDQGIQRYDMDKFIMTARQMASLRGQELPDVMEQRLRDLARPRMIV